MVLSKTNNNYVIIFNGQMIEVRLLTKDFQSSNWQENFIDHFFDC